MKTLKEIYSKICSVENISEAIRCSVRGKKRRAEVRAVLQKPLTAAYRIHELLTTKSYKPCGFRSFLRQDGSTGKMRKIIKIRYFPDQIIHWAIILQIREKIINSSYVYSCGCMPGRGVHYGKKQIAKWMRDDRKHTKYVAKLDISKFYPSVSHSKIKDSFRRLTSDKQALELLDAIIDSFPDGLPIGYLTSQWLSNWFLRPLDYHIKQSLGIKYYVRYMDDLVFFGNNKKKMREQVLSIRCFLADMNLSLNRKTQIFPIKARALDFMGFRFFDNRIILRKSILFRACKSPRRFKKRRTVKNAARVLSYLSWLRHAQIYKVYYKYIFNKVKIYKLKELVRNDHNRSDL